MMKTETQTSGQIWLRLRGYRVTALKPEFGEAAIELEREISEGIPAHPDSARTNFYDVVVDGGWAYIHVKHDRQTVYLVAHFTSKETGRDSPRPCRLAATPGFPSPMLQAPTRFR